MKLFQNGKKNTGILLKIVAIFMALVCVSACMGDAALIIPYSSTIAPTKSELIDLYWEYKDELTEVAEIILASDSLRQELIDNNDVEIDVCAKSQKEHFSEEDWEKVVNLYEKIRPYTIERRRSGAVYIFFAPIKTKGGCISNSLHYKYKPGTWPQGMGPPLDGDWHIHSEFFAD